MNEFILYICLSMLMYILIYSISYHQMDLLVMRVFIFLRTRGCLDTLMMADAFWSLNMALLVN